MGEEENGETMRSKDTRMSVGRVALTQVHQDTGDPVINSLAFCPIPTAVLLTHYKVHRATCHTDYRRSFISTWW